MWNFSKIPQKQLSTRYMPGLDGLRAIAVVAVIIYHFNPQWLPGGFLGVDTFFVISGYLITSLLLTEYHNTQRIDLISFWMRRLKRLLPAVIFLIMSVLILTLITVPSEIKAVRGDAFAALFYVSNWWYIFQDVDYFAQFEVAPLKHLWSLAIEEQFYLFFPIVLFILLRYVKRLKPILYSIIGLVVISIITMGILYEPQGNVARVYFGTDTRLQTMLLGVILAFIWPAFKLRVQTAWQSKMIIDGLGVLSLAGLFLCFRFVNESQSALYYGGFGLISLLTLFIIASAVMPSGLFAKALANPLFIYIGSRSYSLYLWHYPIIVLMHHHFVQGQIPTFVYVIDALLIVMMAELSYRYIETPFRHSGFKIFDFRHLKQWRLLNVKRAWLMIILFVPSVVILSGVFNGLAKEKTHTTAINTEDMKQYVTVPIPLGDMKIDGFEVKGHSSPYANWKPLLIGDSVMVDIGDTFKEQVPNASINGLIGRQLVQAIPLIREDYPDYREKDDMVVLQLGTNGDFTDEQLDTLLDLLGESQIYLVNTSVPRDYQAHVNELFKQAAKDRDNVHLVDWHARSQGHTEYFAPDGIHLEADGVKALIDEIIKTIKTHQK
ncbi:MULTISPECIES: acyltransferase family protein [unclassified Staphylococcus]|uniref:acyltransferase family protein n=1 Tax=unclassified Staphylococcus TaxID=91994 RepID=UPI0021D2F34C|nr:MULTISPECIES: acyltransferase family protein [unclassified Staphylococcus]UXR78861.1 acetyltransferase [Staphylococcus sp. IVB6227]UXR83021.1 acetyltransferase [Staphylococcus sp. IVB6214]